MVGRSRFPALLVLGCALALAFSMRTGARSAQSRETAVILPTASYTIGNSLAFGSAGNDAFGYGLSANGISDYWATAKSQAINFVFFVFPGQASVSQAVTFTVTSPNGATVFSNTWPAAKIGYEGTWYASTAKGNYSTAGRYTATVSADGTLIGTLPVYFAAPSH
jgi:hypothetical protein